MYVKHAIFTKALFAMFSFIAMATLNNITNKQTNRGIKSSLPIAAKLCKIVPGLKRKSFRKRRSTGCNIGTWLERNATHNKTNNGMQDWNGIGTRCKMEEDYQRDARLERD